MIKINYLNHKDASSFFLRTVEKKVETNLKNEYPILKKYRVGNGQSLYFYLKHNLKDFLINNLEYSFRKHNVILTKLFQREYWLKNNDKSELKKSIDKVFFYSSYDKWKSYEILKILDIHCCPYCNRNYISTIGTDKERFFRADFDHFLSKSKYPYFRFHFYNLIPSCGTCNQKAKQYKDTNLRDFIYPYKDGFGNDAKFSFIPKTYDSLKGGEGVNIQLNLLSPFTKKASKIRKSIELFRLNDQYSIHYRELHYILRKKDLHPNGYIEEVKTAFPNLFHSDQDVYEYIFGKSLNEDDFLHQPLSKFTKDIHDELT